MIGQLRKLLLKRFLRVLSDIKGSIHFTQAFWVTIAILFCMAVIGMFYAIFPSLRDGYAAGVFVEFTGLIFDLIFFGFILAVFFHFFERRQKISHYEEEIDDFKKWNSDEAKHRIAGAIRRLAKLGKFDLHVAGISLSHFSFPKNDIKRLSGSVFFDGEWGGQSSREDVLFEHVIFDTVDLVNVVFSPFNPLDIPGIRRPVRLTDCSFISCDLQNACFNGAELAWTLQPPPSLFSEYEDDETGIVHMTQEFFSPFERSNLRGAKFRNVLFKNADFRGAENVVAADFSGATGLDTCAFDQSDREFLIKKGWLTS